MSAADDMVVATCSAIGHHEDRLADGQGIARTEPPFGETNA
ncbi:hypothetical protein [Streptomyces kanasensis]|nr:hypothetical protein [Streptomyces kanasensis]